MSASVSVSASASASVSAPSNYRDKPNFYSGLKKTRIKFSTDKVGHHSAMVSLLASGPSCPGLIPGVPKIYSEEKSVYAVDVYQQRCLEEM